MRGLSEFGMTHVEGPHPRSLPCGCSNCTPQGTLVQGKVNLTRLRAQCARQGIKWPVRIQINRNLKREGTQARHTTMPWQEHIVQLGDDMDAPTTHRMLLHELRHAEQAEKYGPRFNQQYEWANSRYGYDDNPFELDAELASRHFQDTPQIVA